jgi:hypothetical protein
VGKSHVMATLFHALTNEAATRLWLKSWASTLGEPKLADLPLRGGMGAAKPDLPSDKLMLEMFKNQPTALLLDEFQTWYDSLTNTKQYPWKNWAFNFIQILSEIAKENPDLLVLVASVRNGSTDAYQASFELSVGCPSGFDRGS